MTFQVRVLRRAKQHVRHTAAWIRDRSKQGATSWLNAFEDVKQRIAHHAESFGLAPEDEFCDLTIRQAFFKTRRGRTDGRTVFSSPWSMTKLESSVCAALVSEP